MGTRSVDECFDDELRSKVKPGRALDSTIHYKLMRHAIAFLRFVREPLLLSSPTFLVTTPATTTSTRDIIGQVLSYEQAPSSADPLPFARRVLHWFHSSLKKLVAEVAEVFGSDAEEAAISALLRVFDKRVTPVRWTPLARLPCCLPFILHAKSLPLLISLSFLLLVTTPIPLQLPPSPPLIFSFQNLPTREDLRCFLVASVHDALNSLRPSRSSSQPPSAQFPAQSSAQSSAQPSPQPPAQFPAQAFAQLLAQLPAQSAGLGTREAESDWAEGLEEEEAEAMREAFDRDRDPQVEEAQRDPVRSDGYLKVVQPRHLHLYRQQEAANPCRPAAPHQGEDEDMYS
eukprot:764780-Hanusia_phi.AAC.3